MTDRLPCGRRVDDLWDHPAGEAFDQHSRACEYCQAALAEILPVRAATRALAADPVAAPADLVRRVMAAIRSRIRPARRIPLSGPPGMRLDISERAAAVILRAAGDTVTGVRARSCRLVPAVHGAAAPSQGIELTISLRYGQPAPAAARAVRKAVRSAAQRQLGLTISTIDINVADIHLA